MDSGERLGLGHVEGGRVGLAHVCRRGPPACLPEGRRVFEQGVRAARPARLEPDEGALAEPLPCGLPPVPCAERDGGFVTRFGESSGGCLIGDPLQRSPFKLGGSLNLGQKFDNGLGQRRTPRRVAAVASPPGWKVRPDLWRVKSLAHLRSLPRSTPDDCQTS
jgi:hypothetical protein